MKMADKTTKADESLQQHDLVEILSKSGNRSKIHITQSTTFDRVSKEKCGHVTYWYLLLRYNKWITDGGCENPTVIIDYRLAAEFSLIRRSITMTEQRLPLCSMNLKATY